MSQAARRVVDDRPFCTMRRKVRLVGALPARASPMEVKDWTCITFCTTVDTHLSFAASGSATVEVAHIVSLRPCDNVDKGLAFCGQGIQGGAKR